METVYPATAGRIAAERGLLTATALAHRAGLSYRQVDYWTRAGWIIPTVGADGSGTARLYDPDTVETVRNLLARVDACPFRHNHERRNLEDRARSSKRRRDRDATLDAGTDRWLEAHEDLAAEHDTTLEDAVDRLRRTLGK